MEEFEGFSRRQLLKAGLSTGAAALAGCASDGDPPGSPPSTSLPDDSVFRDVSFEGPHLVVGLREDHGVTGLNLIAPDGSTFAQTDVATGATTVRLKILDVRNGLHYSPGEHELVAVLEGGSESRVLKLNPELQVEEIRQYRQGSSASDLGKLAVILNNVGTAPTWVYDITYRNAPNETSNDPLADDPSIPQISQPETSEDLIISPDTEQTYVGSTVPFLFVNEGNQSCSGEREVTVLVGVAEGKPLEQGIRASIGGETRSAGLTGEYTCTSISVQLVGGDSSA